MGLVIDPTESDVILIPRDRINNGENITSNITYNSQESSFLGLIF